MGFSVLKESSAKGKGKSFDGVSRSKLKGNHAVSVVEDTASRISKLGNTNRVIRESNAGIQKRKQKSLPLKVRTITSFNIFFCFSLILLLEVWTCLLVYGMTNELMLVAY